MNLAWFRFYEELNEFLPDNHRKKSFAYSFRGNPSVKDVIEAIGVPHVEVDLILINGISVDFTRKLKDKDMISVYPAFESFDISELTRLRAAPLRENKFILDVHLGKLARYLRLCGFDAMYRTDYDDPEIISISLSENRIILTHDLGLLKNSRVTHGYWIRSQYLREQLIEVFKRLNLLNQIKLFTRCMECNTELVPVKKEDILNDLQELTRKAYRDFKRCPECRRIYWEGSHFEKMKNYIENVIKTVN